MSLPHDMLEALRKVFSRGVDDLGDTLITIDYVHHEVHEGYTFYAAHYVASVANGATLVLLLRTSARSVHLTWDAASGGSSTVTLTEGVTVTAAGTDLFPANMNRKFGACRGATLRASHTPTTSGGVSVGGTRFISGGTGGNARGSNAALRENTEWILKASTNYLITLTNVAGTAQPAGIAVQWYEE